MSGSPRDDERLSAYLDGELPPAEAAELEARLADDPALAAELDAVTDVVAALRGLDAVEPPPGFESRLKERVAREAPERTVIALEPHRERRRGWLTVGVAAAVVAFVGLFGGLAMLQQFGPGPLGGAESPATAARGLERAGEGGQREALADAAEARAYFSRLPEVANLRGARTSDAREAVPPEAPCVATVAGGNEVVARAEPVEYAGHEALAYLAFRDVQGVLDDPEAVVVDPDRCTVELVVGL